MRRFFSSLTLLTSESLGLRSLGLLYIHACFLRTLALSLALINVDLHEVVEPSDVGFTLSGIASRRRFHT